MGSCGPDHGGGNGRRQTLMGVMGSYRICVSTLENRSVASSILAEATVMKRTSRFSGSPLLGFTADLLRLPSPVTPRRGPPFSLQRRRSSFVRGARTQPL